MRHTNKDLCRPMCKLWSELDQDIWGQLNRGSSFHIEAPLEDQPSDDPIQSDLQTGPKRQFAVNKYRISKIGKHNGKNVNKFVIQHYINHIKQAVPPIGEAVRNATSLIPHRLWYIMLAITFPKSFMHYHWLRQQYYTSDSVMHRSIMRL